MKKILSIMMASAAILTMFSCSKDEPDNQDPGTVTPPEEETYAKPVIAWDSNSNFATVDIDDELDAVLTITAEAGIKSVVVTVESEVLEGALSVAGLTGVLDITGDEKVIGVLKMLAPELPTGEALVGKTEVEFDITSLVMLINGLTEEDSNHFFTVKVTDNEDQTDEKTCTFHRVAEPLAAPTVVWTANPDGSAMPVDENLDAKLAIEAEAGVKSIYLTVDTKFQAMLGLETESFDIVSDETAVARLKTIFGDDFVAGSSLSGQTECIVDLAPLAGLFVTEGLNTIKVTVYDLQDQQSGTLECKFSVPALGEGKISTSLAPGQWNPNEINDELEATVTLKSPAMFKQVLIEVPEVLAAELLKAGVSNPLDIVNDQKAIDYYTGLFDEAPLAGEAIRYKKEVKLDLKPMAMLLNDLVSDGTKQKFNVKFVDFNDKSTDFMNTMGDYVYFQPEVKATLTITWPGNEDFAEWEFSADHKPQALHIAAPAGIKALTITMTESPLIDMGAFPAVIDLLDASAVEDDVLGAIGYDFISPSYAELVYGDDVKDKTEIDLNINCFPEVALTSMYAAPGTHVFVIDVEDNSGNKTSATCTFITK